MNSVEGDAFEIVDALEMLRVIKCVEEWGLKKSSRCLNVSEEKVIKKVLEYIENANSHTKYLEEIVDNESRWMGKNVQGECSRTDRENVLLRSNKMYEIIGYRENETERVIKEVEMNGIKNVGRVLGVEDVEVVKKVKAYIRSKRFRVEFLKECVEEESNVMTGKRKSVDEGEEVTTGIVALAKNIEPVNREERYDSESTSNTKESGRRQSGQQTNSAQTTGLKLDLRMEDDQGLAAHNNAEKVDGKQESVVDDEERKSEAMQGYGRGRGKKMIACSSCGVGTECRGWGRGHVVRLQQQQQKQISTRKDYNYNDNDYPTLGMSLGIKPSRTGRRG